MTTTHDRRIAESRDQCRLRIRQEFREMAGLSLTLPQAMRLFGLERQFCERLLNELVADGLLQTADDGTYHRRDT